MLASVIFKYWHLLGILGYVGVLLYRLNEVPTINPDEAGYTAAGWSLLTRGRLGVTMLTGIYDMSERWHTGMPGYPVLATIPFAVVGPSLLAARLLSGAFGLLLVTGVWQLGYEATRDFGRANLKLAATICCLCAWLHPVIFLASRFGRPEIAVAAFSIWSSVLGIKAWRSESKLLQFLAGLSAGLAFTMHYLGAFALVSLLLSCLVMESRHWRRLLANSSLALLGIAAALLPWMVYVGVDISEFERQTKAQVEYQRSRYPGVGSVSSAINELPGRYLLNAQDYPEGWSPWQEAYNSLRASFTSTIASGELVKGVPASPTRYAWLAVLLAALVSAPAWALRPGGRKVSLTLAWVIAPLWVWFLGLMAMPNKAEWYAASVAAYCATVGGISVAIALAYLVNGSLNRRGGAWFNFVHLDARVALKPQGFVILFVGYTFGLSFLSDLFALRAYSPAYSHLESRMHEVIPPGEPVAGITRDWFAFAGRNPFYSIEYYSAPGFNTSFLESIAEQRPLYLVLWFQGSGGQKKYVGIRPTGEPINPYIETSTALLAVLDYPPYGVVEMRKVKSWPTSQPGEGAR